MVKRRDLFWLGLAMSAALATPATVAAAPKRLVLVHGRSQQGLDPAALRSEWLTALRRGGADPRPGISGECRGGFSLLWRQAGWDYPAVRHSAYFRCPGAGGGPLDEEFLVFQAEVAEAVRLRAGVTDEQVDAEYGPNPRPRGPLNWEWVHAILSAIDKHGGGMSQRALEVFTRDVFVYTTPDRRARGDRLDRVRSTERRAGGRRRSFTGLGRRLQCPAFRYPGTQGPAVRDGWLARSAFAPFVTSSGRSDRRGR